MTTSSEMTYSSLISDIEEYCERSDTPFSSQIPRFIRLAENRIATESKPFGFVRTVQGTLSGSVMVKPTRWRKTKNLCLIVGAQRKHLYNRGYEFLRVFAPDDSDRGTPYYYADYDYEHLIVAPFPDLNYQFEMQYYELPEPLSETKQTNWTTQYAPQLLLYGSLMEAMPFLKTSERIQEFQGLYTQALEAVIKEDRLRALDASAVRG